MQVLYQSFYWKVQQACGHQGCLLSGDPHSCEPYALRSFGWDSCWLPSSIFPRHPSWTCGGEKSPIRCGVVKSERLRGHSSPGLPCATVRCYCSTTMPHDAPTTPKVALVVNVPPPPCLVQPLQRGNSSGLTRSRRGVGR